MHGGEGDCCVVVVGAGAGGALTASHLVTGLSSRFRVELVDPSPRHRPRHGVLHPRRPAPAQRAGQRHERVPARPRPLLPLGPPAPRPAGPAAGLRPPPASTATTSRACCARLPSTPPTPASYAARPAWSASTGAATGWSCASTTGQQRATIVARAVVLATGAKAGTDWAPDGAGRVRPAPRPVDRRAARRRPAPRRHRPDDGRRRHRGRPPRPHAAHGLAPRRGPGPPRAADDAARAAAARHHPAAHPRRAARRGRWSHVERTVAETGDWRAAIDGLRPVTAQLWRGLSDDDRQYLPRRRRPRLGRPPPPDAAGHRRAPGGRRRGRPVGPPHRHRHRGRATATEGDGRRPSPSATAPS